MNEMINKFETMMLSLQTATKKIESFMQNMTASVLMSHMNSSRLLVQQCQCHHHFYFQEVNEHLQCLE